MAKGSGFRLARSMRLPSRVNAKRIDLRGSLAAEIRLIKASDLFDKNWYFGQLSEPPDEGVDPIEHYILVGHALGASPHPLFDVAYYSSKFSDLGDAEQTALSRYLHTGGLSLTSPHPLFDAEWYAKNNSNLDLRNGVAALRHFLTLGGSEGRDPHPLFSIEWYRRNAVGRCAVSANPLIDYVLGGFAAGVEPHPCFDVSWYMAAYAKARQSGRDALSHYVIEGAANGYFPNPYFDPEWYGRTTPEARADPGGPMAHYLSNANRLKTRPASLFEPEWYARQEPEAADHIGGPFGHFIQARKTQCVRGDSRADQVWPNTFDVPDVYNSGENTRVNYLAAIGATLYTSLAADAVKTEPATYQRLLDVLLQSARSWRIGSVAADEDPVVSVIIPIYNGLHLILASLESIARCPSKIKYEVIVIDDQTTDDTREYLSQRNDIRYILNPENIGFLRSCNRAVSMARGQYVFLLNNDTMVCPGWLDELVETFDEFEDVGLVGSRLLFPDGSLQEAGGIIWRDASAWNYGRHQDPGAPEFSYLRHVDYISGCAIMTPKVVWDELGGFDQLFTPSYCEDSDLALRIGAKGLRVLYQPMSTIIHFEGMTQGRDETQGIKAYQVINSVKLRDRWSAYFDTLQENGHDVDHAKDRNISKKVLFVDNCTPAPDEDAGSITSLNLMFMLRDNGFTVTFIPIDNFLYIPKYTKAMQRRGIEVVYGHFCSNIEQHLAEYGARYDLVFLFRPQSWEQSIGLVEKYASQAKIIYHTCDLHFIRMEREARISNDVALFAAAAKMEHVEINALSRSDASILHSTAEQTLVKDMLPTVHTDVFGWAIPIEGTRTEFQNRRDIVFVGGYQHLPNVDAVIYFVREVLPRIVKSIPDVNFLIVGSKPPIEVQELEGPNVRVIGFVEDLKPVLDGARLAVAPLRYGGGIKGKVATTLAVGLPTVVTSIAAEGMELINGETVLVADEPEGFAQAVVEAYGNPELWAKMSEAGLAFAEKTFGPTSAWRTFVNILERVNLAPRGPVPSPRLVRPTHNSTCGARRPAKLEPVGACRSQREFSAFLLSESSRAADLYEHRLAEVYAGRPRWAVPAFCEPIDRFVVFDLCVPMCKPVAFEPRDYRSDLICPITGLNNGERLLATLLAQGLDGLTSSRPTVALMEGLMSRSGLWASNKLRRCDLIEPPLAGRGHHAGDIDIIVGNDFLNRAPSLWEALQDYARILRPGGSMITMTAFAPNTQRAVTPARLEGSSASASVSAELGWDLITLALKAGFSDARLEVYHSPEYGHLGGGLFVLRFER